MMLVDVSGSNFKNVSCFLAVYLVALVRCAGNLKEGNMSLRRSSGYRSLIIAGLRNA